MVFFPFIFFICLLIFLWIKNRRIDVAFSIVALFAISAFFSILIDFFDIRSYETRYYDISLLATVTYCFLFLFCFFPIANFSNKFTNTIKPVQNEKIIRIFSIAVFVTFIIALIFSIDAIYDALTGDIARMRALIYKGDAENISWLAKIPFFIRPLFVVLGMSLGDSWIMLFLAFFVLVIQKMKIRYFIFFLFASFYSPMIGIIGIDRSKMTYWTISLVINVVFFLPFMPRRQKKCIYILVLFTVFFVVAYLNNLTSARFENSYNDSLITYLGQSFINYAFFFDNLDLPTTEIQAFFPFTSNYILGLPTGAVYYQKYLSMQTGYFLGVFYCFWGHVMVIAGKMAMFTYCWAYFIISSFLLQTRNNHSMNVLSAYIFMACSSMFYLGLFVNYYTSPERTFSVLFWGLILYYINKNQIRAKL